MTGATFTIHRTEDPSGVSGTGVVAEGWESSDGKTVVLKWLTDRHRPSVCIYEDMRHVEDIHGHSGKTVVVWDSPTQYTPHEPDWVEDERPDENPLQRFHEEDR